ncbi:ImmA/IrrE family metallo-endopeptidase [Aromatoleum anaerobium]|uniref:ImmA/IrrE family metallo-endopeptidase n=1 Tax=Aromatoleum anaerobium TaxID=182180 RepID=UPI001FF2FD3E|nr:ImmA/IrrE family metallo-endopeptidase [Aromatoleum anaerobium]
MDALVRDVYVRQRLIKTTLEEADEATRHRFVGCVRQAQGIEEVCGLIRSGIGFDLAEFRRHRRVEDAFGYLRGKIEQTGIFVLLIGNLGSHHSNVSPEVFRGFALADEIAPFIVINDQDAKPAWSFTVLHELVHIWLGKTGVSGGEIEQGVERFCNDVASRILLPANELGEFPIRDGDTERLVLDIGEFSRTRKISGAMVAYRLYQAGAISKVKWQTVTQRFRELWLHEKVTARRAGEGTSGPDYFVVRRHRMGNALLDVVRRNLSEGILTPTKAGKVLGVRPHNVTTLLGGA